MNYFCTFASQMTKYNTITLENGLRIIHLPSESQVVYCGIAVKAGTRHELPGEEGLAHFCEHLSFKGTEHRSAVQKQGRYGILLRHPSPPFQEGRQCALRHRLSQHLSAKRGGERARGGMR